MCIIKRKYALAENSALHFEEQILLLVMTARFIRHLSFYLTEENQTCQKKHKSVFHDQTAVPFLE
jgi:hypothetical protein